MSLKTVGGKHSYVIMFVAIIILYAVPQAFFRYFSGMNGFKTLYLDSLISVDVTRANGDEEHYQNNYFPVANKGDIVIAHIPIPVNSGVKYPSLFFHIANSYYSVFYRDQLLFAHTADTCECENLLGDSYREVKIPDAALGDEIRIECSAMKNKAFHRFSGVLLQPYQLGIRSIFINCLPEFFLFISILFISFVGFIGLSLFGIFERRILVQPFFFTIFSSVFAMYIISYYGMFNLFSLNPAINEMLEYGSLYLLPLVFCAYYRQIVKKRRNQLIISGWIIYYSAFFLVVTTCHITGFRFYYEFLLPSHIAILFTLLSMIVILYDDGKDIVTKRRHDFQSGLIVLLASVPLEIINFDIHKIFFNGSGYTKMFILTVGILFYLASLFITSFNQVYQSIKDVQSKKRLERLAYTDSLTRLMNRNKCTEVMATLENEHLDTFALIFFDLNNLKTLNDNYGHETGDIYLCSVANALYKVFGASLVCGRMGGDEFLVIMGKDMYKDVLLYIHDFQQQIQEINDSKVIPIQISVACGYVISTSDRPVSIQEAYQQADKNMYENKRFLKNASL